MDGFAGFNIPLVRRRRLCGRPFIRGDFRCPIAGYPELALCRYRHSIPAGCVDDGSTVVGTRPTLCHWRRLSSGRRGALRDAGHGRRRRQTVGGNDAVVGLQFDRQILDSRGPIRRGTSDHGHAVTAGSGGIAYPNVVSLARRIGIWAITIHSLWGRHCGGGSLVVAAVVDPATSLIGCGQSAR